MILYCSENTEVADHLLATRGGKQESGPPQGDGNAQAAGHSEKGRGREI